MVTLTPDGDAAPGLQMCRVYVRRVRLRLSSRAEASRLNNTMPQPAPTGFGTYCPRPHGGRRKRQVPAQTQTRGLTLGVGRCLARRPRTPSLQGAPAEYRTFTAMLAHIALVPSHALSAFEGLLSSIILLTTPFDVGQHLTQDRSLIPAMSSLVMGADLTCDLYPGFSWVASASLDCCSASVAAHRDSQTQNDCNLQQ